MVTRAEYPLRDVTGLLVATHVRIDEEDGKRLVWLNADGKAGLGGGSTADLPLYGSERIGDYPGHAAIVITEGEKAAQALIDAGVPALGTVTGASSTPGDRALAELTGRHVVLWPDNDEVGQEHMRRVAQGLRGIAASIRWLTWVDAPPHGDAADFVKGAGDVWDLIDSAGPVPTKDIRFTQVGASYRAQFPEGKVTMQMARLRARSGEWIGELVVRSDDRNAPDDGHLLQANFNISSMTARKTTAGHLEKRAPKVKADWLAHLEAFCVRVLEAERQGAPILDIGTRPVRREGTPYLLHPMLPKGRATIVFGEGGSGKSYLAAAAAVSVATGVPILDGWTVAQPGRVLVLDWEADVEEWNDRVAAVARGRGIDPPSIAYRQGVRSLVEDQEELARYVAEQGVKLVVVDSVGMASPSAREGTDANEGAIRLFGALRLLNTTCLLVDHVSKAGADQATGALRPYGSIFKVNLARSVYELKRASQLTDGIASMGLYHRKANGGPIGAPIGIRVEYGDDYVRFDEEELHDEELAAARPLSLQVEDVLASGPQAPKDVADALGANVASIRVIMSRAVQRGRLVRLDDGTYGLAERKGK